MQYSLFLNYQIIKVLISFGLLRASGLSVNTILTQNYIQVILCFFSSYEIIAIPAQRKNLIWQL